MKRYPSRSKRYPSHQEGCVVTVEELTTGERRSLHMPGQALDGVRAIAAWCDLTPGEWRVASYSTPRTILADLRGKRVNTSRYGPVGRVVSGVSRKPIDAFPETKVLARIGRLDLLHPRLDR